MEKAGAGKEAGAGAGSGPAAAAAPKTANLETFKTAIRYVLNMGKTGRKTEDGQDIFISMDDFILTTEKYKQILYRGQCSTQKGSIPIRGKNPLEISLTLEPVKPLSTSSILSSKIEGFACHGGGAAGAGAGAGAEEEIGRIFEIHLLPGIPHVNLRDQVPGGLDFKSKKLLKDTFGVVKEEMDDTNGYKKATLKQLAGRFFNYLQSEQEVLLDPRKITFVAAKNPGTSKTVRAEFGKPETWSAELVPRNSFQLDKNGYLQFADGTTKENDGYDEARLEFPYWKHPGKYLTEEVLVYVTCAVAKRAAGGGRRRKTATRRNSQRKTLKYKVDG